MWQQLPCTLSGTEATLALEDRTEKADGCETLLDSLKWCTKTSKNTCNDPQDPESPWHHSGKTVTPISITLLLQWTVALCGTRQNQKSQGLWSSTAITDTVLGSCSKLAAWLCFQCGTSRALQEVPKSTRFAYLGISTSVLSVPGGSPSCPGPASCKGASMRQTLGLWAQDKTLLIILWRSDIGFCFFQG